MVTRRVKRPVPQVRGGDARFLEEAHLLRDDLAKAISASDELSIWSVYAKTEKLVAVVKSKINYETPGTFAKLPSAEPKTLLDEALKGLSASVEALSEGLSKEAVESLRRARNNLRAYLSHNRKATLKAGRDARKKPSAGS